MYTSFKCLFELLLDLIFRIDMLIEAKKKNVFSI